MLILLNIELLGFALGEKQNTILFSVQNCHFISFHVNIAVIYVYDEFVVYLKTFCYFFLKNFTNFNKSHKMNKRMIEMKRRTRKSDFFLSHKIDICKNKKKKIFEVNSCIAGHSVKDNEMQKEEEREGERDGTTNRWLFPKVQF